MSERSREEHQELLNAIGGLTHALEMQVALQLARSKHTERIFIGAALQLIDQVYYARMASADMVGYSADERTEAREETQRRIGRAVREFSDVARI